MLLLRPPYRHVLSTGYTTLVGVAMPPVRTRVCTYPGAAMKLRRGIKKDSGKPALDLIDPEFELEMARVLTEGAKKYAVDNWRNGMSIGKCMAGIRRHLNAIARGEHIDPEWGLQHAAHAACGVMFLHYFIRTGKTNVPDDRWEK